ncbi:hypothetical protein M3Y99_01238500 [Aphelenchoides fujianensis]|nr:hypothetical protein M3Y99_01238500 [Aphelenchoides fujianensis]
MVVVLYWPLSSHSMDLGDLQRFLDDPNDEGRIGELHRQFAAVLHARRCMQQKTTQCCKLSICPTWRSLLCHYSQCHCGLECDFEACGSTRVLLDHFQTCAKPGCRFCEPLRKSKRVVTTSCSESVYCNGPSTSRCSSSTTYCETSWSSNGGGSARETYFQTYRADFTRGHRSSELFTSTIVRTPYGKTERIQRELIVMFHVQRCADLDRDTKALSRNILCSVPHCSTMKRTLIHIAMCQGEQCDFPECEVTRSIIQHWLRCPKRQCDICNPVLNSIPAIDGGADYEMDDKLLALLYTSTNGLMGIVSSDITPYEADWPEVQEQPPLQEVERIPSPLGSAHKRKCPSVELELVSTSPTSGWKKRKD